MTAGTRPDTPPDRAPSVRRCIVGGRLEWVAPATYNPARAPQTLGYHQFSAHRNIHSREQRIGQRMKTTSGGGRISAQRRRRPENGAKFSGPWSAILRVHKFQSLASYDFPLGCSHLCQRILMALVCRPARIALSGSAEFEQIFAVRSIWCKKLPVALTTSICH